MEFFVCDCIFFFFKQKTAYEMRISDWSSDVCSSDLRNAGSGTGNDDDRGASTGAGAGDGQQQPTRPPEENEPGRQNLQGRKEDFIQTARIDGDYLKARLAAPVSRYEVKIGRAHI